MAEQRTRMRIIGDILATTRDDVTDGNGTAVTHLIRHANISHGRLTKILSTLVSQGLLEQSTSAGACRYRISGSGREFLDAYKTFSEFAEGFGLTI